MYRQITDEVLDTSGQLDESPRYRIRDNNGDIISDNVQLEMKTPVLNQGTPLNRATFSELQGDMYSATQYNVPFYGGTQMIIDLPVKEYYKGMRVNIEGGTSSQTWNEWVGLNGLGAEITYQNAEDINLAFNNDYTSNDGYARLGYNVTPATGYIQYNFKEPIVIKSVLTCLKSSGSSSYWSSSTLQGSNNGTSWTTLATFQYQSSATTTTISNTTAYKYLRLNGTVTASTRAFQVYVFKVTGYTGKRYAITNPLLNINSLGAKIVNGTIEAGQKYTLCYNGTSWDIVNDKFVTGTYTGDDTTGRIINLGFTPKAVILSTNSGRMYSSDKYCGSIATKESPSYHTNTSYKSPILVITDGGFIVSNDSNDIYTNSSSSSYSPYKYIAFK